MNIKFEIGGNKGYGFPEGKYKEPYRVTPKTGWHPM